MKIKQSRYLIRLLIYSLILGIIPVITLGTFSYFKSSDTVQKKVNEANLQVLLQSQMRVEEVLKSIHNYYSIMANSTTVTDYLDKKLTYNNYDAIVQIQKGLSGIQSVQASVKNASYINLDNNWLISPEGISSIDDKMNRNDLMKALNNSKNSFWMLNKPEANIFRLSGNEQFNQLDNICLIIKVPLNLNKPSGAIIVNLLGYEFIKTTIQSKDTQEMLVLDDKYNLIVSDGEKLIDDESPSGEFIKGIKEHNGLSGFYKARIKNIDVGISYRKSAYNDWTYISVYSIGDITKDSRSIGFATMIMCIVMTIGIFVISFFGSTIIYNPIRNLYNLMMKNTEIEGSGKNSDELKYIGEGINTLVENQSHMAEQIEKQKLQLEEFFLIKLVNGELSKSEIEARLKGLRVNSLWKWSSILSIQVDNFEDSEFDEGHRDLVMLSINNIVCNIIDKSNRFQPTLSNKVQVVLVGGNQNEYSDYKNFIFTYCSKIQEAVKQEMKLSISIGISRPFDNLEVTQIAFKESQEALMCGIRFGPRAILYFEDVQPDSYIKQPYPKQIEDELIDAINQGDSEKAEALLCRLIDEIFKEGISYTEYQICLVRLLTNIAAILQDSGESVNVLFNKKGIFLEQLYNLKNPVEIKKWFKGVIIRPVIALLEEKRGSQYRNILDSVLKIIHEEYDTDLSLESCADRLNYHPSYIWRVLRKEMSINFSDYLAKYRLERAKEWLESSSIPVSEIAERLRYNNSQNFIRYFKKLEGITPGQYREKCKEKLN